MRSRTNSQLNLPPSLLRNSEQGTSTLLISEQATSALSKQAHDDAITVDEAIQVSSQLIAEALKNANINYKAAAHLTGVSDSLAQKWCSPEQRESPSHVQQLRLGVRFNYELHKAINRHERFGFGRLALGEMLRAAGMLALAVER